MEMVPLVAMELSVEVGLAINIVKIVLITSAWDANQDTI